MNTPNNVLMERARETLKGKWTLGVEVTLVYFVLSLIINALPKVSTLVSLLVSGPFTLGLAIFWLSFSRNQESRIGQLFEGFNTFLRALKAWFLVTLFTLLWTLLLIIPGIVAAFKYALTYYILADDKSIGVNAAINKSIELMDGNKWKLFRLELRFLGWGLLCVLTLGIGFLWLIPYASVTMAKFYDDVKNGKQSKEPEIPSVTPVPTAQ